MGSGSVIAGEDQKSSGAPALQREGLAVDELPRHQLQPPYRHELTIVALELFALGKPLAGGDSRQLFEQVRVVHGDKIHRDGCVVIGPGRDVQGQAVEVDTGGKQRTTSKRDAQKKSGKKKTQNESSFSDLKITRINTSQQSA